MRRLRWIIYAPAALIAFFPSVTFADGFSDGFGDLSNWTTVANGGNGVRANGQLKFSYGWGEVVRSVFVEEPSDVTLTVNVWNEATNSIGWSNPTVDEYRVSLGSAVHTGNVAHGWLEIVLHHTTTEPNQTVLVSLGGIDRGFWAGWYGPVMDDLVVSVSATNLTTSTTSSVSPTTTSPATTTSLVEITSTTATQQPSTTESTVETTAPTAVPVPTVDTTVPETTVEPTIPETTVAPSTTATTTTVPATTTSTSSPVPLPETTSPSIPSETVAPTPLEPLAPSEGASEETKQAFEAQVDVFSGQFDDYVPSGSKITVGQRRTVVAATAILVIFAPPPSRSRRK